jgi:hypothetical protein
VIGTPPLAGGRAVGPVRIVGPSAAPPDRRKTPGGCRCARVLRHHQRQVAFAKPELHADTEPDLSPARLSGAVFPDACYTLLTTISRSDVALGIAMAASIQPPPADRRRKPPSIRWRPMLSLSFRSFHPPQEIVGKARKRAFKRMSGLISWFALGR